MGSPAPAVRPLDRPSPPAPHFRLAISLFRILSLYTFLPLLYEHPRQRLQSLPSSP